MVTIVNLGPGNTTTPPPSIFTPPSSCSTLYTYEDQYFNNVPNGLLLQNALGTPQDTECYPTGVTDYGRVSHVEIYSPGVCPVGYTTPAQYVSSSTTTVICCPNSLKYTTILTSYGESASDAVLFAGCISTLDSNTQTEVPYYDTDLSIHSSYTTVIGPITMWAQPMQFAFQQKDLSLFTTTTSSATKTSATSTTAAAAPSSTISSLAPSSATSSPAPSGSKDLSAGAKAGIGVGVGVGAVLLIMALLFFLLARRKQKRNSGHMGVNNGVQNEVPPYNDEPPKPGPGMVETGPRASYLDSTERIEMPHPSNSERRISEMPAYDSHR